MISIVKRLIVEREMSIVECGGSRGLASLLLGFGELGGERERESWGLASRHCVNWIYFKDDIIVNWRC